MIELDPTLYEDLFWFLAYAIPLVSSLAFLAWLAPHLERKWPCK